MPVNILFILIGVVVVLLLWLWITYNHLVKLKQRVDEAWSDIDVQLKRRYDLIPNLVNAVKGYMSHERETLEAVIQARQQAVNAHDTHEKQDGNLSGMLAAESMLSGALKNLFALAENYPDLKASQNFMQLQDEISDTENKIQAARRFYNGNVRDFNIATKQFPTNVIANAFNFVERAFFEASGDERKNVEVKF